MLAVNSSARIRVAVAPLNAEARISSQQTSQLLAGHVVSLLENQGEWWRVRGADAYEGWLHAGYIEPSLGDEANWAVSLGATVRRKNGVLQALPLNARFASDNELVSGEAIQAKALAARFPRTATAVADIAVTFFAGTSYLWGGATPWGADCSGLVQTAFALCGHRLPRDAWQQAECGEAVAMDTLAVTENSSVLARTGEGTTLPGDLLFFSDRADRRITHVALALANHQFIHSGVGRGGVFVEDARSDEEYVRRLRANFICTRRVLPP